MKIKKRINILHKQEQVPEGSARIQFTYLHFPNFRPSYSAMIGIYKASVIYQREHSTI